MFRSIFPLRVIATVLTVAGAVPLVADTAPAPGSVTPNPATGASQNFTLTWSSTNGQTYSDITEVAVLVGSTLSAVSNCEVRYYQSNNSIYLVNDADTAVSGPLKPGASGTLSNSQCTVNGSGTTVSGSSATLTLSLSITATSAFSGTKNVYMWALDTEGSNSRWQARGTWTPAADSAPVVGSVTPTPASGANQTFTFTWSTTNGKSYTDLTWAEAIFNYGVGGAQDCYVLFNQPSNSLYLENDNATGKVGPLTPGSSGTLSNSQCTVNGTGTSVSGSGAKLTLNLSVTASSGFLGKKNVYMWAQDSEGSISGWQAEGTWTPIGPDSAPVVVGANKDTFYYATNNGKLYTDLKWVEVVLNGSFPSPRAAHSCYVSYYQPTNNLYLQTDDGLGKLGPVTPGASATLSNSQCVVNAATTTVSGRGETSGAPENILVLHLSWTAQPGFGSGDGIVWMWTEDSEGLNSGWLYEPD